MTTNQKGAIAETAVVHAAIKLGIDVYRPVMEGGGSTSSSTSIDGSCAFSASGLRDTAT